MNRALALGALVVAFAAQSPRSAAAAPPSTKASPGATIARAATVRIGVFDSRAVALAYWRSAAGMRELRELHEEYAKAKAANDEERVKELEREGPWRQVRMHQQVFSTATAAAILQKVSDKLPAVAKEAGAAVIVSKWEVPYTGSSVETVDVTLAIVRLFNPDEKLLKGIEQLLAQPPIAFEKLPLDPNM